VSTLPTPEGHAVDQSWGSAMHDPRVELAVTTGEVVTTLAHRGSVGSTQDEALELVRRGAASGLLLLTDRQLAGRGRRGRTWDDSDVIGASLALTLVIDTPGRGSTLVPHAVGLALHDAITALGVPGLALKWPNDLVHVAEPGAALARPSGLRRKLAGILVERERVAERDVLLVGVGVNIGSAERFTAATAQPERCDLLELLGMDGVDQGRVEGGSVPFDRAALLAALVRAFDARLGSIDADPGGLLRVYRSRCETVGRRVTVELPDGRILHGPATGIDDEGHLLLDVEGTQHVVVAGTVR
jgi:BirA family transcriptional regulator, biotin operon repressor / biotin---[acetyl-CoA-carboxylase] ligase